MADRTGVTMALNRHPVDPVILSAPKIVLGDSSRALSLCDLLLITHLEGSKSAKNLEESLFVRHGCAPAHGGLLWFSRNLRPCGRWVLACWHDNAMYRTGRGSLICMGMFCSDFPRQLFFKLPQPPRYTLEISTFRE